MVRYYAYNPKKRGSKYVEITEEQYLNVKIQPNRWFISFGNCVLECEKSEYDEYYRQREHSLYTLRNASGKRPDILSLEAMDEDVPYEISVFSVHTEQSVEDAAEVSLQKQQIRQAYRHLSEEEIYLIRELLIKERMQSEIAQELHISQQAVSKRFLKAIRKLREAASFQRGKSYKSKQDKL